MRHKKNLEIIEKLRQQAEIAISNSYCRYSNIPVGAALLTPGGEIYKGCNIEIAALSTSICAEESAIAQMVSTTGGRHISAILILSKVHIWPCGNCRERLNEFLDKRMIIYVSDCYGKVCSDDLRNLFPHPFDKRVKGYTSC